MKKNPKWLILAVLTVALALTVILYSGDSSRPQATDVAVITTPQSPATIEGANKTGCAFWSKCDYVGVYPSPEPTPATVNNKSLAVTAGKEEVEKVEFQMDAKGNIVVDEQARLNIEKLYALNEPGERAKKHRELEESLPPAANRELTTLMARYDTYQEAQLQAFPPGQELSSAAAGLAQLDALHELRVQHFGATVADGFFGAEEKLQRELLMKMSMDKDRNLTLDQKAARAQSSQ